MRFYSGILSPRHIFILTAWMFISDAFSQSNPVSVYFKNFVRHSEGEFCTHIPPATTFTAYLNHDQKHILIENAPRWEKDGDPNIPGMGTFGVELGNFDSPALMIGDSILIRFTCKETGQQGLLAAEITNMPWYYFPTTLYLMPRDFPGPPQSVSLKINSDHQRVISWDSQPSITYSIYRRDAEDTIFTGRPRMLYHLLASGLQSETFIDTTHSVEAHGYIVIPTRNNVYGPHSHEVVDFPAAPRYLAAAVANNNPLTIAITWDEPGGASELTYRIFRAQESGVQINPEYLLGETRQLYWLDSLITPGEIYYYRVAAVNVIGVMGPASDETSVVAQSSVPGQPDLDVLYISRTPRYPRFEVEYGPPPGYNPHLKAGTETLKHYPQIGDTMTYTTAIRNSDGRTVDGFRILWYVDSVLVQTETRGILFPHQRIISRLHWPWEDQPIYIRCQVQPLSPIDELSLQNNQVTIRSNALSFHFHVEKNILNLFESQQNPMDSYSFEDWARVQINTLNRFFEQAVYPLIAPDGVPERVFLDTVSYYENGNLPGSGTHAPQGLLWDGQWGFTGDASALDNFQNVVLNQNQGMDWALLHELGHQLGLIDLYNMDVQESEFLVTEPRTGQKPDISPIAWDVLYYCSRSQYLMHSNFSAGFSDHSAGALVRNFGQRRGYFGEYLADIPSQNVLQIRKSDGTIVPEADIWIYQMQDNIIPDIPKFHGQTDLQGIYKFPHKTDTLYHGGIYVKNPFSSYLFPDPNVVGTNAVLFIRVAKGDSVGYRFMDICNFNVAYWNGNTDSATYNLKISHWQIIPATAVKIPDKGIPTEFKLYQNSPNPFNSTTHIRYQLPRRDRVKLVVYNTLGEAIRTLVDQRQPAGIYSATWEGQTDKGQQVPSGIYFYKLSTSSTQETRRMILIK